MMDATHKTFGTREVVPKRPWIGEDTLELLAQRAALVQAGRYAEAESKNKPIKKSARSDRKRWLQQ
eukprot:9842947-Alexandrium_andersonii.AAC.1